MVAVTFIALLLIPVNFDYWIFAVLTFLNGIGSGMFAAPNRTAIMNSVPANQRGAASGMTGTFQNAGNSLSIGIFFSLMIAGLASTLPTALSSGLAAHHVPDQAVQAAAQIPPVGNLFAAFHVDTAAVTFPGGVKSAPTSAPTSAPATASGRTDEPAADTQVADALSDV